MEVRNYPRGSHTSAWCLCNGALESTPAFPLIFIVTQNLLWKPSNGIDPAFPSIGVGKNDPTYQAHQALTNIGMSQMLRCAQTDAVQSSCLTSTRFSTELICATPGCHSNSSKNSTLTQRSI